MHVCVHTFFFLHLVGLSVNSFLTGVGKKWKPKVVNISLSILAVLFCWDFKVKVNNSLRDED